MNRSKLSDADFTEIRAAIDRETKIFTEGLTDMVEVMMGKESPGPAPVFKAAIWSLFFRSQEYHAKLALLDPESYEAHQAERSFKMDIATILKDVIADSLLQIERLKSEIALLKQGQIE